MKDCLINCLLIIGGIFLSGQTVFAGPKDISFKTADGWTIHGRLTTPDGVKGPLPVVILLPSEAHDRAAFGIYRDPGPGRLQYPGLEPVITARGVATLSLDLRGRGRSIGGKEQHSFTQEEAAKIYLDVQAALAFLSKQPDIDSSRIGIVAIGKSAEAAILGWGGDKRVRSISLISGRLSETAKKVIAANEATPLLLVVSSEDRSGFADMTDAYFLSKSKETDIKVYTGIGIGTMMFSVFRYKYPDQKPLHDRVGDWIADELLATGTIAEVSFQTEDGWTIFGNLRVPQTAGDKMPAVILLHSGLSDRYAYDDLEVMLSKAGLAVLNIDWRGKGKSTGKGKYFDLSKEERDRGYLDALGAVRFLAARPDIDASRLGILGTVIGAKYAMAALAEDARLKTAVVLTGYVPTEKEKVFLTTQKPPVLYITSTGHDFVTKAMTDIYLKTKESGSELSVYEGGAIGYQLFKLDKELMPRIVSWMKQKLGK